MVTILMMSAKMATKNYDVIVSVHDLMKKMLSRNSDYIVFVVMWPKFGLIFHWEKLSWPLFYKDLTRKTTFFEGPSWFKVKYLGLALDMTLKFYVSVAKGSKLKVRKCWELIEVTGKKLVGGFPQPTPPIQNRVNLKLKAQKYI